MKKRKRNKSSGRNLALTIIIGIFIAIMVISLFNLIVDYAYPRPEYGDFCNALDFDQPYLMKVNADNCCDFSKTLQEQQEACYSQEGQPVFEYDDKGCPIEMKECDMCYTEYEDAMTKHNRISFFIFAAIGFALIVFGLLSSLLLLQIVALPSGAFLVIEAAVKNFDDKLYVIIVFTLLIIAAIYLALKRLGEFKK